jgi:hypothetical protein
MASVFETGIFHIVIWLTHYINSFACSGAIFVVIAWFILPEVARRTPGEIDEL